MATLLCTVYSITYAVLYMNRLREEVAVHSKTKLYTLDKPVEGGSSGKFDNIYCTLDEPVEVGSCGTLDNKIVYFRWTG